MSRLQPETAVMLCNDPQLSTQGAPVLIMENQYPCLRFLRIKALGENPHFNPAVKRATGTPRRMCLVTCKHANMSHDGTPTLLVEVDAPEMREPSYVEI